MRSKSLLRTVPPEAVAFLVYERKNEHYPEHQPTSFYDDARRLQAMIPGRAVRFGDEHGHYVQMFHTTRPFDSRVDGSHPRGADARDRPAMSRSASSVQTRSDAHRLAEELGLNAILPGFATSEHVFEPAGYSLNALKGAEYYTDSRHSGTRRAAT